MTVPPPPPPSPPSPDADDLAVRMEAAAADVLAAIEAHTGGEIDFETFRLRAFEAGVVTDGSLLWLLDVSGGRWVRYDGLSIVGIDELTE